MIISEKPLFWVKFRPLLAQKLQTKLFPKKSFSSILNVYAIITLCEKSEILRSVTFDNTWNYFCPLFGPILSQKP